VDAVAKGERPPLEKPDEIAIHDYCSELFAKHSISDESYSRAHELFGTAGVVELTALIGYYSMVALTLLAHQMPLPEGGVPLPVRRRT